METDGKLFFLDVAIVRYKDNTVDGLSFKSTGKQLRSISGLSSHQPTEHRVSGENRNCWPTSGGSRNKSAILENHAIDWLRSETVESESNRGTKWIKQAVQRRTEINEPVQRLYTTSHVHDRILATAKLVDPYHGRNLVDQLDCGEPWIPWQEPRGPVGLWWTLNTMAGS